MRRFEFRLESVLKLKKQQHRQAELAVRQAQAERDRIKRMIVETDHAIRNASEPALNSYNGFWHALNQHAEKQRADRAALVKQLLAAENDLQEKARVCIKLNTELESLVQLRNSERQDYERELLRHRQHEVDDTAMNRWNSRIHPRKG